MASDAVSSRTLAEGGRVVHDSFLCELTIRIFDTAGILSGFTRKGSSARDANRAEAYNGVRTTLRASKIKTKRELNDARRIRLARNLSEGSPRGIVPVRIRTPEHNSIEGVEELRSELHHPGLTDMGIFDD